MIIFLQSHPNIDININSAMAENRSHHLSIESSMDILYSTSDHQQERAVDTLIFVMLFLLDYFEDHHFFTST